jgi:Ni/Fe-hydrogenase subunit HybB-like protein
VAELSYKQINEIVLAPLEPPGIRYNIAMTVLAGGIAWAAFCWVYQIKMGMGVAGLNHPVGWGAYITNFVFWVGIAHSGTLISAILHLVRSRWRTAVSRSAEAMTVFAVMTAGLFPLIHLGRVWAVYYIIPYPSQRQLWPDFLSPLVWDVCAVGTYFTVSSIFWYVGMIPDLASARDRFARTLGPDHFKTRLYRLFALGWSGSGNQWHHYGRGYLFFAALATPLVISVHSVVSWDFAVSLLPGWHSTIFAPYFVAGAIHSGLAMVLTLMIPMRRLLHLENVITPKHFEAAALTMLATTAIVGYAYIVEPFMAWYSGDIFERQFMSFRATGWIAILFWSLAVLNVLAPLTFIFKRVRRSLAALLTVSILVNVGMWLERYVIIVGSTSHDFMPHNWLHYQPTWVEISITAGAFCFFLFLFVGFTRKIPTVSISDVKEDSSEGSQRYYELDAESPAAIPITKATSGVLAVFSQPHPLLESLRLLRRNHFDRLETYSPVRLREAEAIMGRGPSPVRFWTLTGAVLGVAGGFALAIGTALVNQLIAGGKHPVSIIPYCIVGFEGTILLGTIGNFMGMLLYSRLGRTLASPAGYDGRFTLDRYGVLVGCQPEQRNNISKLLLSAGAEEIHDIQ